MEAGDLGLGPGKLGWFPERGGSHQVRVLVRPGDCHRFRPDPRLGNLITEGVGKPGILSGSGAW